MFTKNVKINGAVYGYHEVIEITHAKDRATAIRIRSYANNPNYGVSCSIEQVINLPFDDTMTFSDAEDIAMERPEFDEYIDPEQSLLEELAPTLTDEQAATVPDIYPEWRATESYSVGDRVRYSNGFYKCVTAHDAQADWNPSAASSLWAAIIDATVLPIGEYPLWQQPESTNPYMTGDIVTFGGQLWTSVIDNNVWAPGIYGWDIYQEEQPEPGPDEPTAIPEWAQPDSTNPYMSGDKVRHNGSIWQSNVDNNVWEPGVYGWDFMEEDPDFEPENSQGDDSGNEPVNPSDGGDEPIDEPTTEPEEDAIPEWAQPDSTNPYMMGDLVTFQGSVYESLIDNNIWSPSDYPQGWSGPLVD